MSESLDSEGILDIPFHGQTIEPLYKEIAEYQQLLDTDQLSDDDRYAFIESLDTRWPYMNKTLTISGNVYAPHYEHDDDEHPNMIMEYVEDIEVESLGFGSLITGEDENSDHLRAIGHYLLLGLEQTQVRPMEATYKVRNIFAKPEDIVITYPFTDESEDAARLSYFFEETIADIDNAFIEADDECEIVAALGNIEFPIRSDDTIDELSLITKYINSRLEFDKKVPYLMDFEGFCYEVDDLGVLYKAFAQEGTTAAYPLSIETTNNFITDEDDPTKIITEIAFGLRIELLTDLKERDSGTQLVVPINDSFAMRSIRPYIQTAINSINSGE